VHIWNDSTANTNAAKLFLTTTIKNYAAVSKNLLIINKLINRKKQVVAQVSDSQILPAGSNQTVSQSIEHLKQVVIWDLENPYLYQVETSVLRMVN